MEKVTLSEALEQMLGYPPDLSDLKLKTQKEQPDQDSNRGEKK